MPQVRVAKRAPHLPPGHPQREVAALANVFLGDGRPEARPAGSGFEFAFAVEQRGAAASAAEDARAVLADEGPGVGNLRASLAGDGVLRGVEPAPPLLRG